MRPSSAARRPRAAPSTVSAAKGLTACKAASLFVSQLRPFGSDRADSFSLDSCKPNALCQSQTTTFTSLNRVQTNASLWNGNVSAYDWVGECCAAVRVINRLMNPVNSGSLVPTADGARLTLNQTNGASVWSRRQPIADSIRGNEDLVDSLRPLRQDRLCPWSVRLASRRCSTCSLCTETSKWQGVVTAAITMSDVKACSCKPARMSLALTRQGRD